MGNCGSTNTVDQLLGHTKGPAEPVTDRDLARARSSAYIVHGNFHELAQMCDNISTTVTVIVEQGADETDVENEVYRRVHNYVSSLYSFDILHAVNDVESRPPLGYEGFQSTTCSRGAKRPSLRSNSWTEGCANQPLLLS